MDDHAGKEGPSGRTDDVLAWAAAESAALLGGLGDRWPQVQGVVAKARWVGETFERDDGEHLVAAAHLHAVGYAPELYVTGLHQLDGARHIRAHGHERLAGLVAHHTESRFELGMRGYASHLAAYPSERSEVSAALIYCVMTTGPTGAPMEFPDRVADLFRRHGPETLIAEALRRAMPDLALAMAGITMRLRRFGRVA
ncbi:MAG: hypothetical protein QOE72_1321 [Chloroflexota bacterium]|jgi:hypothetical protein|nr:hypothetical protein [Chloroflexota bacterium]